VVVGIGVVVEFGVVVVGIEVVVVGIGVVVEFGAVVVDIEVVVVVGIGVVVEFGAVPAEFGAGVGRYFVEQAWGYWP